MLYSSTDVYRRSNDTRGAGCGTVLQTSTDDLMIPEVPDVVQFYRRLQTI